MNVEDVMTKNVWTCRAGDSLSCAARLMWDHDIGAVPIVSEENKLVGIVTDRDLCMASYFSGERMCSVPLAHAMSKVVYTVESGQRLETAEELMRAKQIRRLPVLDGDRIVGMITLGDLARAMSETRQITPTEVSATLAAIFAPRATSVATTA